MAVQSLYRVRRHLGKLYKTHKTWEAVSALSEFEMANGEHISRGTLNAIWKHGRNPKDPEVRRVLRMAPLLEIETCSCGQVHLRKSCPNNPRWHDLDEIPTDVLRWQLENRKEFIE